MVNKPKMQGTAFESWMVNWLFRSLGVKEPRRIAEGGMKDQGDITWTDGENMIWVGECKATQTLNVPRVLSKARLKSDYPVRTVLFWKRLVKLKDGQKHRRPDGEPVVVVMGLDTFNVLMSKVETDGL